MKHRHLNHHLFTLAAIDNIIQRGGRADWAALRDQAVVDKEVCQKVLKVCEAHACDPYAQRYHLWRDYARRRVA
jgi:hypothetical protein